MTWWMAFTAIALAGPIERTDARTLGGSVIDEFAVLDLTTTHAAIKLVSHLDPELAGPDFGEPVNCGYAGMEKLPYSGVTLALVELKTGELTRFTVYEATTQEPDCMSHEDSTKVLKAAKERFASHGLDITKRPTPLPVTGDSLELSGQRFAFSTTVKREDEAMVGMSTLQITRGKEVLYRASQSFNLAMAGSGKNTISGALPVSDHVVFVERFDSFSGRGGGHTAYTLTAPIPLSASK